MNPNEAGIPNARPVPPTGVVQFDGFELHLETGELRRNGMRVRLQPKPFQILAALLERPGRVVTREELRMRLWPNDTFVDFESGLNTAANRLRLALGDSAENPRYIETLSRLGYRFVAPVRRLSMNGIIEMVSPPLPHKGGEELAPAVPQSGAVPVEPPAQAATIASRSWRKLALAGAFPLVLVSLGLALGRLSVPRAQQSFRQISFRRGLVTNARFTQSGEVVYSARWGSDPPRVFLTDTLSPESRDLGVGDARLAAVSASSELALFPAPNSGEPPLFARVPMHGGAPRVVGKSVSAADFSPLSGDLCIAVVSNAGTTIEMPPGSPIFRTSGWVDNVRVAPDGRSVALLEHELKMDDGGGVVYIGADRRARRLTAGWASIAGLAWVPSGKEVWFSAARSGTSLGVWGVALDSRVRPVSSHPGSFVLFDAARDGRILASRLSRRLNMMIGDTLTGHSADASWFDWTRVVAMSADGDRVLFDETGAGGGDRQAVYLRHVADHTVERVGDGHGLDLSADGRSALTQNSQTPAAITLITGSDVRRTISAAGLAYQSARFIPGRNALLVQANAPGKPVALYVQDLATNSLRLLRGFDGVNWPMPSPDGRRAVLHTDPTHISLVDLDSGAREDIVLPRTGALVRWSTATRLAFMEPGRAPIAIWTFDLRTHKAESLTEIAMPDPLVRGGVAELVLSSNLRVFAYSYVESSSELLLVDGWK